MEIRYGMFVHDTAKEPYAEQIANRLKLIETRKRDMLKNLVGQRVLIIRTRAGHKPDVLGTVLIYAKQYHTAQSLDAHRNLTLIPEGSKYDCTTGGKWGYWLSDAEKFTQPIPLDEFNVTHKTRSWAEIAINQ